MPLPSAPRRAAPPRKKAVKPSPQETPVLGEETVKTPESMPASETTIISEEAVTDKQIAEAGDREEEIGEVNKAEIKLSTVDREAPPPRVATPPPVVAEELSEEPAIEPIQPTENTKNDTETKITSEDGAIVANIPKRKSTDVSPPVHSPDVPVDADSDEELPERKPSRKESILSKTMGAAEVTEESTEKVVPDPTAQAVEELNEDEGEGEEAARRKRVAEKLAKMGGVNPFAPPPQRKPSVTLEDVRPSPPISPNRERASLSRESFVSPPPQARRDSLRKSSLDSPSTALEGSTTQTSSIPSPPSRKHSVESPVIQVLPDSSSGRKSQDGKY
jgi:hypothetical protein